MKKLLFSVFFLLSCHILSAQGSWMPEKTYWPRTLIDSSQALVQEVRDRVTRAPYSSWYASILTASDINYSSCSWEKQKARIARCAAFRFFIEGDTLYGDKAKDYLLVANREDAGSITEEYTNIIWDSEIISMISIAYDFLKGNNYDFGGNEQAVRDRIQWVTGSLYHDVVDDDFGLLHYAWVVGHGEETNYGVKLASAVGMAAIVLNTETSGSNHTKPSTWIEYAVTKLYRQFGLYLVDQNGGWAEGHHYLGFSAVNFIPFAFSYENFTDGIPQVFGSTTYPPPLQQYRFQQNTEWGVKIRMPDGSRPPIDDSFLNSYYYSAAFASYYENDVLAWDYIHSDQPYNTWASSSNIDVEMICLYDDAYEGVTEPDYTSAFLPEAGQAVFRNNWDNDATYMCLIGEHDMARTGGRSHEHPDNMSFIVHALGEYLAMDSGYISWNEHDKVRYADNHNLILVNGSGPSSAGTYTANGTNAYIQNYYDTRFLDYAEVQTNYQNVDFTRCATFFDNKYFILTDFISSSSTKSYEWLLHGNGGGSTGGQFTFLTDDSRTTIGSQYTQNNVSLDCYINSINSINFSSYDDYHDDGTYNVPATHTVTKATSSGSNTIFSSILIPHESTQNLSYEPLNYGSTIGGLVAIDSTKILTLAKDYTYGISTLFDSVTLVFNAKYIAISKENGAFQPTNVVLKYGDYLHYDDTIYFIRTENRCDLALHIDEDFADGYVSEQGWVEFYTGNEPSFVSGTSTYNFSNGVLTLQFDQASNFYLEVDWSLHPISIDSLSSTVFSADDELTIFGSGFEQSGNVLFNTLIADELLSWSETEIKLIVPEGVSSGELTVENSYGTSNAISYQITSSTGDPEVAQPIPNHVITAGTTKFIADLNVVFWDPNGDALLFSVEYDSPYLVHNEDSLSAGKLYFTAQDNAQDTLFVTATAQDPDSASASDQFIVFIQDYNDPPQIDTIPTQFFNEDDSLIIAFSYFDSLVFDPDNSHDELTYSFDEYAPLDIQTLQNAFHVHAPVNWFGQVDAIFPVFDGQNLAQENCVFSVQSINDPPEIALPDSILFFEDDTYIFDMSTYISDIDDSLDNLVLSWIEPQYIQVQQIGWDVYLSTKQPDWNGTDSVQFTITDDEMGSDSDIIQIRVLAQNDPPFVLDTIPDFTRDEDFTDTIQIYLNDHFSDPDNDPITYSILYDSTQIAAYLNNDLLQISSCINWFGDSEILVTADDGYLRKGNLYRDAVQDSFFVYVLPVNDPPQIVLPDTFSFFEDDTLTVAFDDFVSDIDNELRDLTLSWIQPDFLIITADDWYVSFTNAVENWNGFESVTFTITDSSFAQDSDTTVVHVYPKNDPPFVLDTIPDFTRDEDFTDTIQIYLNDHFSDPDNDPITYSILYDSTQIAAYLNNDLLQISSCVNWFGDSEILVTADDGYLRKGKLYKDAVQDSFFVHVLPVNDPPQIVLPDTFSFFEDDTLTVAFDDFVSDVDNELGGLTLSWLQPDFLIITADDWYVSFTNAVENWNGLESVTFTITDSSFAQDSDTTVVHVYPKNDPPFVLDTIPDFTRDEDFTDTIQIYLNAHFDDPDSDPLTYSVLFDSTQISALMDNEILQISSYLNWFGSSEIIVIADDGNGSNFKESTQDSFFMHVLPVNDPPQIVLPDTFSFFEDDTLTVAFDDFVSDIDNELRDLTLSWIQPNFLTITADDWYVSFTNAVENWNGLESVTFTITDSSFAQDSDTTVVHVYPQNDPPYVLPQIEDFTIPEDTLSPINVLLDLYFHDPDGDELSYAVEYDSTELFITMPTSSEISILPQPDWFGTSTVTVIADDGFSYLRNRPTIADTFNVIVEPINDPPIIRYYIPDELDIFLSGDSTINFEIAVFDVDNDTHDYTWTVNDTIQSASDSIFVYHFDEQGIFSVMVVASDQEYEVSVEWQIEVSYFPAQEIDLLTQNVSAIKPNPFNPNRDNECELYFVSKEQKNYSVNIYNISGQFIKSINSEFIEQKREGFVYQTRWNGRNENGLMCTSGLYLFKVNLDNKTYIKKMLILH